MSNSGGIRLWAATTAIAVLASLLAMAIPASAQVAPQINLLNPSSHSSELSDKSAANTTYRLNSWASGIESYAGDDAIVEFDLLDALGDSIVTIDAVRLGDVFERQWDIPQSIDDGPYRLRATLYTDDGAGYQERSSDEMDVTVSHGVLFGENTGNAAEATDIVFPLNAGPAPFYDPPGSALPAFIMDLRSSAGTTWTINKFTTSSVGEEPTWQDCAGSPNGNGGTATFLCQIPDAIDPTTVTGLASVANDTPRPPIGAPPPNPSNNDSGDAIRIFPYAQVPTTVALTPETQDVAAGTCATFTVLVSDQFGRRVPRANVDIHAQGPDDQLNFDTSNTALRAPDQNHGNSEVGSDCTGSQVDDFGDPFGNQGEHSVPGGADIKHVETETASDGRRTFRLWSENGGLSEVMAWSDSGAGPGEADNDLFDAGEPSDSARARFGVAITIDPTESTAPRNSCQRFVVTVTEGGSPPAPDPSNVDVHISGPTPTVDFCTPADATPGQSMATGHGDPAGTKHLEGPTDSNGKFIFGVTSPAVGDTAISAWRDDVDNDVNDGDPTANATAHWTALPDRQITINSGRRAVPQGRRTRIFGRIVGDEVCTDFQTVNIQARNKGATRWYRVKALTTNGEGRYGYLQRIRRTRDYRAIAPATADCERAVSRVIRIRRTRN